MLHPESTAYNLFDGKKYPHAGLPKKMSAEARESMRKVDSRLAPTAKVLGIEIHSLIRQSPFAQDIHCLGFASDDDLSM